MQYEITSTEVFDKWFKKLRDRKAALAVANRITRAAAGNLGDIKPVGEGISEMRIFVGKGYRVYFCMQSTILVVLLVAVINLVNKKILRKPKQWPKHFRSPS